MIENLRLSLSDLLGADYTRAVCEARALLTGENPEALRALADESFKVWLVEDATRAATEELQVAELTILNNIYCHVVTTDELLAAL